MLFLFLLIFLHGLQNSNQAQVPLCKGAKVSNSIYDASDYNKTNTLAKFSFDINVVLDKNNATYPNIVTLKNFDSWSINSTFNFNYTIQLYLYDFNGNSYYCLWTNTSCIYNFPNYYAILNNEIVFSNGDQASSEADDNLFFYDGTITYKDTFFDEQNKTCMSLTSVSSYPFSRASNICCTDFEYINIPDSNDEICQEFETKATFFLPMNGVSKVYYVSAITFATKNGVDYYINSNTDYFSMNSNNYPRPPCIGNSTCSQSFLYTDVQLYFNFFGEVVDDVNGNFDVIVGGFSRRNGMYFKNNNVSFTQTDPCWRKNGSLLYNPYYAYFNIGTYETSFCCIKFQSNDVEATTPSSSSLTTTNIPTFAQVPICNGVKFSGFLTDSDSGGNVTEYSFDLKLMKDENNETYPNVVIFSNFNGWSINSTFDFNNTINFMSGKDLSHHHRYTSLKVCSLNGTCSFNSENGYLYFNVLPLYAERGFGYPTVYIDSGTTFDEQTGALMNSNDNPCIKRSYDYSPPDLYYSICCNNYGYVEIPTSNNEICQEFETNVQIFPTNSWIADAYLSASSCATEYGINTYVETNITPWNVFYGTPIIKDNYAVYYHHCQTNYDMKSSCSQPFPLGDFQLDLVVSLDDAYSSDEAGAFKVGELIRRNGMYYKNSNVPYTSIDPCWIYNGSVPYSDFSDDGRYTTYETSFCCTKFGHNDIQSNIPTTAITHTSPTTKSTIISPTPSFQPPLDSNGTPCSTDTSQAWLDILFVIDTSSTMGKHNLRGLAGGLETIMETFNIAQNGDHTTRVGIITYATSVTVRYQLNDVTNFNDLQINFSELPSYATLNDNGVNADDALQQAFDHFESQKSQRIPLIVLIAAGYDANGFQNTNQTAKKIKDNGISIITIDFGISDSTLKNELGSVASTGYNYTSDQEGVYDILPFAFTQINCFCPQNSYQLRNHNLLWNNYTNFADCYYGYNINTNPSFANCDPGVLVAITSLEKFTFITDTIVPYVLKGQKKFTIGLHKSEGDLTWKWWNYDKSEFPYDNVYPEMSQTPAPSDNYGYMWRYSGFNWKLQTGNNVSLPYVCQMKACDAAYICDQSPLKNV